jgi:hypothetical protein
VQTAQPTGPGRSVAGDAVACGEDPVNPPALIALDDYRAPAMPTDHVLRAAWTRLKQRFLPGDDPLLPPTGLEGATLALIDDLANPPDCGPMLQALEKEFGAWSRRTDATPRLRALVMPPCDDTSTLEAWARRHGHELLGEPERIKLIGPAAASTRPDLDGDGLLVIPRLEHWFLRQRNGLHAVRSLLARLARTERRCLVGCDSWAWRYLVKCAGADLALPRPQCFEPFDARRLRDWFAALACDSGGLTATFRLAGNGDDVLAVDDDGQPRHAHLRQIAARSAGIPWVALHLWQAGLKVSAGEVPLTERAAHATAGDARTVWVVDVDDTRLPPSHEDRVLLVLQALLIHGALTPAEIDAVLPTTGEPEVLAALVATGQLRRDHDGDRLRVRPSAYPAVRQALQAAGFPTGAI